jgi:hypothetical protein
MTMGIVGAPACAVCGSPSARVELVPPGELPAEWDQWTQDRRDAYERRRDRDRWYLLFQGVAAGNGDGDPVDAKMATRIAEAFRQPLNHARVRTAGFYDDAGFCQECDAAYCYRHWHVSPTGFGHCPGGHGKSLDPLW